MQCTYAKLNPGDFTDVYQNKCLNASWMMFFSWLFPDHSTKIKGKKCYLYARGLFMPKVVQQLKFRLQMRFQQYALPVNPWSTELKCFGKRSRSYTDIEECVTRIFVQKIVLF